MKKENRDLAFILVWPIIAVILSFVFRPQAIWSVLFFLAIPSLYLAFQNKKMAKKAFLFSIATTILVMLVIDYISHLTGAWFVPNSVISFRFFGLVPIENLLWAFFTCFFIVIFYEYFLDKHAAKILWSRKMKYLLIASIIGFAVFLFLFFNMPSLLSIPYFYVLWGVFLLFIPFMFQLARHPKVTSKFFLAAAYFFYLHFIYEVTALKLNWWIFPGTEFIGWVSLFGVSFPVEEVIFWFILLALAVITAYEFFDDNER